MMERVIEPAVEKAEALRDVLASLDSVIVAYSGGVDSAYLAYAASRALGDRAIAITADSPSYPEHHRRLAIDIAERTPKGLASYDAAQTTDRFPCQATMTGLPRSWTSSRCSTEA